MIELRSGEFYWVQRAKSGSPFMAEYQEKNYNRDGTESGPCFWRDLIEVEVEGLEIIEHIRKPGSAS